jgi:hypothetical protein
MDPWLLAGWRLRRLEFFSGESCTPALALKPWDHADQLAPSFTPACCCLPHPAQLRIAGGNRVAMKVRVGSMGNLNSVPMRR